MREGDIQSLIAQACAAPAEPAPRAALLTWLERHHRPLARLVRLQLTRSEAEARSLRGVPTPDLQEHVGIADATRWWVELAPALRSLFERRDQARFDLLRGMAGAATVTWDDLSDPQWKSAAPLEHLDVIGPMPSGGLDRLLALPGLQHLRSLSLIGVGLDDRDAARIAAAPWPVLRCLAVDDNPIGQPGAAAFLTSTTLPRLIRASFVGNPFDPCERATLASEAGDGLGWFPSRSVDHAVIQAPTDEVVDTWAPPEVVSLWRSHGRPPWSRVSYRHASERGHRYNLWDGLADQAREGEDFDHAVLLHGRLERVLAPRSTWRASNLTASTLLEVDLHQADLTGASLVGASIERARFDGATAPKLRLDRAHVARADFSGANLMEATFEDAVVMDTSFRGVVLACSGLVRDLGRTRRARFVRCDFRDADMDQRELIDVEMVDCRTEGMRGTPYRING